MIFRAIFCNKWLNNFAVIIELYAYRSDFKCYTGQKHYSGAIFLKKLSEMNNFKEVTKINESCQCSTIFTMKNQIVLEWHNFEIKHF